MFTILLSPSKTLDETPINLDFSSTRLFKTETAKLVNSLKQMNKQELATFMKISPKLAEINYLRFQNFNKELEKQAIFLFKGDVYDNMDVLNYSHKNLSFAQQHLRILSGLYGILKPLDLIKPYRLEMGKNLKNDNTNNLYEFWSDKITQQINTENPNGLILNLASNEYFKVINRRDLKAKVININLKQLKNGQVKTIGVMAKKARGLMANYIIKNNITQVSELKEFSLENYLYKPNMSDEDNLTFIKEI